jgi:hypothetical protein
MKPPHLLSIKIQALIFDREIGLRKKRREIIFSIEVATTTVKHKLASAVSADPCDLVNG